MVQSAYRERIRAAVAGMIVDMSKYKVITGICATVAGIGFGLAVSRTTGRKDYIIGGSLAAFVGATVLDNTLIHATADKYARYDNMGIMVQGQMWVSPAVNIARGDPVHFSTTTGQFTNTGGAGPILGAEWIEAAAAGDIGIISLPEYRQ